MTTLSSKDEEAEYWRQVSINQQGPPKILGQEEACFKRAAELIWSDAEPERTSSDIKRILLIEFGPVVVEAVAKRLL